MLWVGHFKTISGHFSTNYIKNFYKSKLLTNILRCQTYLNLNWMIIYDINTIFSESLDFQFWKKISWKFITGKWPFFHCFWSFFANFMSIFHETEVQTVILRCLVSLNLNWVKSYFIILVKKKKNPCLKMHYFRAISPKWILDPQKEISCHIFKVAILTKILCWSHEAHN